MVGQCGCGRTKDCNSATLALQNASRRSDSGPAPGSPAVLAAAAPNAPFRPPRACWFGQADAQRPFTRLPSSPSNCGGLRAHAGRVSRSRAGVHARGRGQPGARAPLARGTTGRRQPAGGCLQQMVWRSFCVSSPTGSVSWLTPHAGASGIWILTDLFSQHAPKKVLSPAVAEELPRPGRLRRLRGRRRTPDRSPRRRAARRRPTRAPRRWPPQGPPGSAVFAGRSRAPFASSTP